MNRTILLTSFFVFILSLISQEAKSAEDACEPTWIKFDSYLCYIDHDSKTGYYEIEFRYEDAYVDTSNCYQPTYYTENWVKDRAVCINIPRIECCDGLVPEENDRWMFQQHE